MKCSQPHVVQTKPKKSDHVDSLLSCPWLQLGTTLGNSRLVVSCLAMNEYDTHTYIYKHIYIYKYIMIVSIVMHLVNVSVMLIMLRTESAVMKIQLMFYVVVSHRRMFH